MPTFGTTCVLLILSIVKFCSLQTTSYPEKWCVTNSLEWNKCQDMGTAFRSANLGNLTCVKALNRYECMRLILNGGADLVKAGDTDIYSAVKLMGLLPAAQESTGTDPSYRYLAVVVVKVDGPIQSVSNLRGKKSCHTGVGRTVGWTVPVSNLQAKGIMPVVNCDNPVRNVAEFSTEACSPGAFETSNNLDNDNPPKVCSLCRDTSCPSDDFYSDYIGALRCLLDGRGNVAFVKHSTVDDALKMNVTLDKANLRLLCPNSTLRHVNDWTDCTWARRPTDVIVTSSTKSSAELDYIRTLLETASGRLNSTQFNMFSSRQYGGSNLLFTDGTVRLRALGYSTTVESYLEEGFINTITYYRPCQTPARWCIISEAEVGKCRDMAAAFSASRIHNNLTCVKAADHQQCMKNIQEGLADLTLVDGGDVYTGGRYYGLVPIMAEAYNSTLNEPTSYWAVAVVRRNNPTISFTNLKGKKSCHTGIQRTAGWNVPIGILVEKGYIRSDHCNMAKAVSDFFSQSCVPGVLDPAFNPKGDNLTNLCALCGGPNNCSRNANNIYDSYKGAFRCLIEKNADVAFVKHTTVSEYIDSDFAARYTENDFQLLCLDGTRKDLSEWRDCNLARVPSHAVVTSSQRSATERKQYLNMLERGLYQFGKASDDHSSGFYLFESPAGQENLIFQDSANMLVRIPPDQQDYEKWLSAEYLMSVKGIDSRSCTTSKATSFRAGIVLAFFSLLMCMENKRN